MQTSLAPLLVEVNQLQIAAGVYQCEAPQPTPGPAERYPAQGADQGAAASATSHSAPLTGGEPMVQGQNALPVDPLAHWDVIVQDVDEPTVISDPETLKKKGPRMRLQATEELVAMEKQILHIPSNQNVTP